jgi:O-antigen ligase
MATLRTLSANFSALSSAGFYLIVFILLFAPLWRGGNRSLPLMILELAALALIAHAIWLPRFKARLSRLQIIVLGLFFLLPLCQLLVLPISLWMQLPGHDTYTQAMELTGFEYPLLRSLSLIPYQTESAWLKLLPPLAVFIVTIGLPVKQLRLLVNLLLGIATFQALLGLIQYGDGPDSLFRFGNTLMGDSASGTYINRNHLAGLLEMVLPVSLALLLASVGRSGRRSRRSLRHRLQSLVGHFNRSILYAAVFVALLLGLIFTQARAGILLAMLGILLSMFAFARHLGGKNIYGWLGTFTVLGIGLALEIGLAPVLRNFTEQDMLADQRWSIYSDCLIYLKTFFPLGSGVGTFADVYRQFQSPQIIGFVNRAHNDYLEWILGGGIVTALLLFLVVWFYLIRWVSILRYGIRSTFHLIQTGAGIGLLLVLLHGLVDFNLHIPANNIFFAFLAAVFLCVYDEKSQQTLAI